MSPFLLALFPVALLGTSDGGEREREREREGGWEGGGKGICATLFQRISVYDSLFYRRAVSAIRISKRNYLPPFLE